MQGWRRAYFDIAYYNDKFYAVNCLGDVVACDLSVDPAVVYQVAKMPTGLVEILQKVYMVESAGALLVATRSGVEGSNRYGTYRFDAF